MTASSALRQEVEGWEVNSPKSPNKRRKNQQQSTKRGGHTVQMSRRKLNAVKAYKTESIAKERRHGEKTREKRGRRGRGLDMHDFVYGCDDCCEVVAEDYGQNEQSDTPAPASSPVCTNPTSLNDAPPGCQSAPEYKLFGDSSVLSSLCGMICAQFPTSDNNSQDNILESCNVMSKGSRLKNFAKIPFLSLSNASACAKTIKFLQQELDILALMEDSAVLLDDIPSLYNERYGLDIWLPECLCPEDMLELSQRVLLYDYEGQTMCDLTDQHEYPGQQKASVLFFLKQEFRILSLLGEASEGLTLRRLLASYEQKYGRPIVEPHGQSLADVLRKSSRTIAVTECPESDVKYQLVPYMYL